MEGRLAGHTWWAKAAVLKTVTLSSWHCTQVEGRLAGAYVTAKAAVLDDRLEELLFLDAGAAGLAPLPAGVRGAAMELANCLVRGPRPPPGHIQIAPLSRRC